MTGRLTRHPWAIMKTDKEGVTKLDDGFTAAGYLARLIWKAVNEIRRARDGETDDLTRLDFNQYFFRRKQYDPTAPAFVQAAAPLVITGTFGG